MGKTLKKRRRTTEVKASVAVSTNFYWQSALGHQQSQQAMISAFKRERLPQVLLIEGRQGIGKPLLAAFAAGLWLCETNSACGRCPHCLQVARMEHPEVFCLESEDSGSIGISAVDAFLEHLSFNPQSGPNQKLARIGIIVDVDQLTTQAANRLLKTLEEPADHAFVVMTTSKPGRIMPTILSRTVRWRLAPPKPSESSQWLVSRTNAAQEKIEQLLKQFGYAPGQVLRYFDEQEKESKFTSAQQTLISSSYIDALDAANQLCKSGGKNAVQIAESSELIMNREYRQLICDGRDVALNCQFSTVRRRREILSQVHRLAGKQRIALNSQLTAEAVGLS